MLFVMCVLTRRYFSVSCTVYGRWCIRAYMCVFIYVGMSGIFSDDKPNDGGTSTNVICALCRNDGVSIGWSVWYAIDAFINMFISL